MRGVLILVAQLAISVFLAVSLMPLVLVSVPAAQEEPRLGLGLMAGVGVLAFVTLVLVWPRRRS